MTTITKRLNDANGPQQLAELTEIIYSHIDNLIQDLVMRGVFVDNGMAVIPYEEIDVNDQAQLQECQAWELDFVTKAHYNAYRRWVEEKTKEASVIVTL